MEHEDVTQEQIEEARKAVVDALAKYDKLVKEYLENKATN